MPGTTGKEGQAIDVQETWIESMSSWIAAEQPPLYGLINSVVET